MKKIAILILIALAGCQDATSSQDAAPSHAPAAATAPMDHRKQPDGTCKATLIHDSLVEKYVPYGSYCRVPDSLRTPHKDGSLPDSVHGAGVAYSTWTTNDGNCEPRAWAIDNVVNVSACLKPSTLELHRWLFDTAYKMPNTLTWGM